MTEPIENRLKGAYWVCSLDGSRYGAKLPYKTPTFINGWCDICETHKQVTEFRNYGNEKKQKGGEIK